MRSQRARSTLVLVRELVRLDLRHLRHHALNTVLLGWLVLTVIGFLLTLGGFHYLVSPYVPFHGVSNPKYALGGYEPSLFYLSILIALILCLRLPSFREDSIENVVITYRSPSNFLLALSRVLSPTLLVISTLVIVALMYQLASLISLIVEPHIVEPIEPWSLVFVLVNLVVMMLFWTSLGSLVSEIFKSRTIGFVGTFAMMLIQAFVSPILPSNFGSFTFGYGAANLFVSDISPDYVGAAHLIYWFSVLCLSFAAIYGTALFHRRMDPAKLSVYKPMIVVFSSTCIVCQVLVHTLTFVMTNNRHAWVQAYESAAQLVHRTPTVNSIEGNVWIDAGTDLRQELTYTVGVPESDSDGVHRLPTLSISFALNPGIHVEQVDCGSTELPYSHQQGILEIDLRPCEPNNATVYEFKIRASGKPDPYYLVTYIDDLGSIEPSRQLIQMMGQRSSVFTSDYVALTQLSHWYPQLLNRNGFMQDAGAINLIDISIRIDLQQPSWSLVGSGGQVLMPQDFNRQTNLLSGKTRSLGLLASEFQVEEHTTEEINVNVLVHQRHANRLASNESRKNSLIRYVTEAIAKLESYGIDYPFNQFSIVEIPSQISILNKNSGTNIGLDSILMFREVGLPFARASFLEKIFEQADADEKAWLQESMDWQMLYYWTNPIFGPTYDDVIVQGLLSDRVYTQDVLSVIEALVLEIVLRNTIESDNDRFDFDIASSLAEESRVNIPYMLFSLQYSGPFDLRNFRQNILDSNSFWESIERSFDEDEINSGSKQYRFSSDQRRRERVQISKLGELIGASFEERDIANALATTLATPKSRRVDLPLLISSANAAGMDIAPLLGDTLFNDKLPGIYFSEARQTQIQSSEEDDARFVTVLDLRNGEDVAAYAEFEIAEYGTLEIDGTIETILSRFDSFGPIKLEGNTSYQLLLRSKDPVGEMSANTFLSLNRGLIEIPITNLPSISIDYSALEIETDWFSITSTEWIPFEDENVVIVDDLDPGFVVQTGISTPKRSWWNLGIKWFRSHHPIRTELDNGLPSVTYPLTHTGIWARSSSGACWGRYRHTYVFAPSSTRPIQEVSFNAELPRAGRWALSYHFPDQFSWGGDYAIAVRSGVQNWDVTLDSEDRHEGWTPIGTFEIESHGRAQVLVRNDSSVPYVVADAIRWNYLK